MFKHYLITRTPLRFKHFTRKRFALFSCLGKEVIVGVLSVSTLTYAKASGMSTNALVEQDSIAGKEVKLDEVIVTSARAPLTMLQSAKIVGVITHDEISRSDAQSVNDVLKLATGVDVRQRGGFGVQTDISINGGTFDQITILLNGVNISSPQTGHNAADFPVSLNDIERIEILEGASARVFGSSAFNGAINIVTRSAKHNSGRVALEGGSFGSVGTEGGIDINVDNKLSGILSSGYERSDGGTSNSDFNRWHAYANEQCSWKHFVMNWQFGGTQKKYGANTFYSAKFPNQWEDTRRLMASVGGQLVGLPKNISVTSLLYWLGDNDHYQLIRGKEGANYGENYHSTDIFGANINASLSWLLGKTAIGAELRKERIYSTAYGEKLDSVDYKDIHGSDRMYNHKGERTNTSIFIEHNVILGGLTLSAGLLANKNTGLDGDFRFYPGVDISYRPDDNWKFYASWNKALRVPTYTDLYTSNVAQQGDVNLKPEKNDTYKIGSRYRVSGFEAVVSGFYMNGKDMIDWVYETSKSTKYHAMNIGKLDNMGASIDATINFNELLGDGFLLTKIKVGYAYIHQKHETELPIYKSLYALEYLRQKFVMQVEHRIWRSLSANWALRWQERMNGYSPYTKIDGRIQWTAKNYKIYVKADNITAHRYYDLGAVRQPGIWIMAGCAVNLDF